MWQHVFFSPHLTVFDKISNDWTASITPCPPLQIVYIRLVSLRRAGDDRCLWSRTVTAPISWQVDCVTRIFIMALVALHGMERRRGLWQDNGSSVKLRICQ